MSLLKTIWGLLFRLFPCPTRVGLRRVGDPKGDSPVLVTCNFDLTVKRLIKILEQAAVDAWLLVADSKGVNVWCAAGAEEFNTHSVVSSLKTSGVAGLVDHRVLILPPLGAPGICAAEVQAQTGWTMRWGPVRAEDIPRYLTNCCHRDEGMKRVTYKWDTRLDTALGSVFPFYLLGVLGFTLFGRGLLVNYLLTGAVTFLLFYLLCPWIPGRRGLTKVLLLELLLGGLLIASELSGRAIGDMSRANIIIAMVMLFIYSSELGGLAPNMPSDLDPFLARLGLSAIGNIAFAGTIRAELLNGDRKLSVDRNKCIGCRSCHEICPQGVWEINDEDRAALAHPDLCTACRACLVQCPSGAITALKTSSKKLR
ncbi:MAG: 4Fe-4S binding protein [Deltaproteobacteria bacterium]|nr:4Fe-4S binding protein [Deltaproteobacteria bacterium]